MLRGHEDMYKKSFGEAFALASCGLPAEKTQMHGVATSLVPLRKSAKALRAPPLMVTDPSKNAGSVQQMIAMGFNHLAAQMERVMSSPRVDMLQQDLARPGKIQLQALDDVPAPKQLPLPLRAPAPLGAEEPAAAAAAEAAAAGPDPQHIEPSDSSKGEDPKSQLDKVTEALAAAAGKKKHKRPALPDKKAKLATYRGCTIHVKAAQKKFRWKVPNKLAKSTKGSTDGDRMWGDDKKRAWSGCLDKIDEVLGDD